MTNKKNLLLLQSAAYVGVAVGGAWGLFTCAVGLAKLVPSAKDDDVSHVDAEPVDQHRADADLPTCADLDELAAETDPVP